MMMLIQQPVTDFTISMMRVEIELEEILNAIKLVYLKEIIMENLIITDLSF